MATRTSRDIMASAGALGAGWILRELLKTPTGERFARVMNHSLDSISGDAASKVKTVKKKAVRNRGLLSAGIAVVAVGLAIIGRASTK